MNKLVLLRGCPGAGKSTSVTKNNLDIYTLSSDKIRLMLREPEVNSSGLMQISQQDNKLVFELLDQILEHRMSTGSLTIVDQTHCSSIEWHIKQMNRYVELAEKYNYIIYYYEPERLHIEKYLKRNRERPELYRVPDDVIKNMYNNWVSISMPQAFKKLDNLNELL